MQVDFMIIGAQKCGTTSLANQIAQHPDVAFCKVKEPHYFSREADRRRSIQWYHNLFRGRENLRCAEGSTSYTFFPEYPETVERIHKYNPSMRFIYVVRDPIARIESQLTHDRLRGHLTASPERAVFEDPRYLDRSRYATQMRRFIDRFDRSAIHLEVFERMIAGPESALRRVLAFLDLDPAPADDFDLTPRNASLSDGHLRSLPPLEFARRVALRLPAPLVDRFRGWARRGGDGWLYRQAKGRVVLSDTDRARLRDELHNEVEQIERLLGTTLTEWRHVHSS